MNLIRRIAGAARLLATGKLTQSTGFEGAQMQRRLMAWRAGSESIGELQRGRAWQLVRSNPYAANAAASFTAHAVGCGIKPSSLVEDGALKDRIQRLWLAWTDEADANADGLAEFYGLQAMAARAMFEAGECLFRFRSRRPEDGLRVPFQLQMLSSEHLPLGRIETLAQRTRNHLRHRVRSDRAPRRLPLPSYHPGDARQRGAGQLVRVPAEQVGHVGATGSALTRGNGRSSESAFAGPFAVGFAVAAKPAACRPMEHRFACAPRRDVRTLTRAQG